MGSLLLSSWCAQNFVCALQDWSLCFPQSSGRPSSNPTHPQGQIPWGFSVPLLDPQAGKPDVGFRMFRTVGELLWYYCSSVCGSPIQWVWDLILLWLYPLLLSHCSFFFVFGCGISFFGGFQYPPVNGCSTASCNFGVLTGGDEHMSFYSAILNLNWIFAFLSTRIIF